MIMAVPGLAGGLIQCHRDCFVIKTHTPILNELGISRFRNLRANGWPLAPYHMPDSRSRELIISRSLTSLAPASLNAVMIHFFPHGGRG